MATNDRRGRGRGKARGCSILRDSENSPSVGGDYMTRLSQDVGSVSLENSPSQVSVSSKVQIEEIIPLKKRIPDGALGRSIDLLTNHFKIDVQNIPVTIYRYEVKISRMESDRKINRDANRTIFWEVVRNYRYIFQNPYVLVYDDVSCLFSADRLAIENGEVALQYETRPKNTFAIKIKYTTAFAMNISHDGFSESLTTMFLNLILTQSIRCPRMRISNDFYPFGRSVYLIAGTESEVGRFKKSIGPGLETWNGFHGGVKIGRNGELLYNGDIATSVFAKMKLNVIDLFIDVINERERKFSISDLCNSDIAKNLTMDRYNRKKLETALSGLQLCVLYGDDIQRSKLYRFVAVGQPASVIRFSYQEKNTGNNMILSVEEYFFRIKGIRLKFPNLPVIQVGPKARKIYIPMELLMTSTKPQKILRNLTEFQKSELVKFSTYSPSDRMDRIKYMLKRQELNNCQFLSNCGVSLDPRFLTISGRILPPPQIATEKDEFDKYKSVMVKDGWWKLTEHKFTKCHRAMVFCVVSVDKCFRERSDVVPSLNVLMRACQLFGMKFATFDYLFEEWNSNNIDALAHMVRYFKEETRTHLPNAEAIVLFLMKAKDTRIYGIIKKVCDLEESVACQCVTSRTFRSMRNSKPESCAPAHNLCLKINVKMGGVNSRIYPHGELWKKFVDPDSPTLHVGVDVTHPGRGLRNCNSIAGIVANVDVEVSRFGVYVKMLPPRQERVVNMDEAIREHILGFSKMNNNRRPKHIIIYRDGISESEFAGILREELSAVKTACLKLDEAYKPTISYVVVQKRHHTRFFVTKNEDGVGRFHNVPPGTVVEERITSPSLSDFFLASHAGTLGTTRPSHYYVLYDSWNCSANEWQILLHGLCHLFCRCNKSVSIPAPVFYAHLVCARASIHSSALLSVSSSDVGSISGDAECRFEKESINATIQQPELSVPTETPQMYFV